MMQYENGEILLTSKIRFASLIPNQCDLLFFSSYCIDDEWLFDQLAAVDKSAPVWLCMHYDTKTDSAGIQKGHLPDGRSLTILKPRFPPYMSYGIMHAKLIIYRTTANFIRVIVSSGNLMPHDYDEGPIQNILYVQDFKAAEVPSKSEFFTDLSNFVISLGAKDLIAMISAFDYSNTEHVKLVYSIPGTLFVNNKCCGLEMLERAFSQFQADIPNDPVVTVQGSSLGKLTKEWLWQFYHKVTGSEKASADELPKVSIVFPTESFATSYGVEAFGTIFCQSENWYKSYGDLRRLFCKCAALSPLHTKIITVGGKDGTVNYLGSHNFTMAAWGRYTKAADKLMVNNYELGVVVNRAIPIPFKMPAERYSPNDLPWMQDLHY